MPPLSNGLLRQVRHINGVKPQAIHTRTIFSARSKLFAVAEEVENALATGKPVVALETTIYTHGYPYPENVALASRLESLVRLNGGVPATIGIVDGKAHVGMRPETLIQLVSTAGSQDTWKLSRRDLGFIGGLGLRGKRHYGGTTIAGTMILAHLAGIKVFATGGLGGVHRNGENSMDISADLTELGRTPVVVVSSGCKSFLDIPRTLEYLETQGVGVGTFADGRSGKVDFPAFWSRDSGVRSPQTIENEADAAAIAHAQFSLPVHSGLLFANPVPVEAAVPKDEIESIIAQAVSEADQNEITGSANTPYILKRIRELSNGRSVVANQALIEANVIRGTKVAVELAKLELHDEDGGTHGSSVQVARSTFNKVQMPQNVVPAAGVSGQIPETDTTVDVLIVGSLACDTMCDYKPFKADQDKILPTLRTSNPGSIGQSVGGVGRNVAVAAHLTGAEVSFASAVADDIAGHSLLEQVKHSGLKTDCIRQLATSTGARTAQYVAMNDQNNDLMVAMADMSIFARPEFEEESYWSSIIKAKQPKWLVMDANWSPKIMSSIIAAARRRGIPVAFEPVSTAKSANLFHEQNLTLSSESVVPQHVVNMATPNIYELKAMHLAAQQVGLFDTEKWWLAINSFGLSSSGSREKFVYATDVDIVDQGIPQQSIQLLPYIPCIVTKLGSKGVLLTTLLKQGDDRLADPDYTPYILARNDSGSGTIGGVYMRLFPPAERLDQADIQSVNGVGDTLLGVLVANLAKQAQHAARVENYISVAQQAAVLTLKSREAVSPQISSLR